MNKKRSKNSQTRRKYVDHDVVSYKRNFRAGALPVNATFSIVVVPAKREGPGVEDVHGENGA